MRRIAFGVLVIVMAGGGLSACGDGGDDSKEDARPERTESRAEDFETLCDAVVEYAMVTVPPGSLAENGEAVDALQELARVVNEDIDPSGRTTNSGAVVRQCSDDLLNVLQAAAQP